MSKLRKEARGRQCMVNVPGICTGGGEDTVLAHYRHPRLCGMGQKPDDRFGAWACHACHDAIDGRNTQGRERDWLRQCHAQGVMFTQDRLIKEGKI